MKTHLQSIIKESPTTSKAGIYVSYTVLGLVAFIFFGTLSIKPRKT